MTPYIACDIETDGLNPTKIHVMSVTNDEGTYSTTDYDEMREFLQSTDDLVIHYGIMFDKPVLERLLDIKIKARVIDTVALSWVLDPKRGSHGLASHGEDFGVKKPEIEDWDDLPIERYIHRCEEDTKINWLLWKKYWKYLNQIYSNKEKLQEYLDYLMFKLSCARKQEESKWKLDVKLATESVEELERQQLAKISELEAAMPDVPVIKVKSYPARPLKKDGTLSSSGKAWYDFLEEQGLPKDHREDVEYVSGFDPPNPNAPQQIKAWLYSLGWVPRTFKYKKTPEGKDRPIPQINKEHGQGICDSIKDLYDKEPRLEVLEGLSIINHRLPLLKGFINNADEEGFLQAQVAGLTNTLRFQHTTIVNLPAVGKPWGNEIRGSLVARPGKILAGSDQSSLEDRLKQHFAYPLDPKYVETVNKEGYDPHLTLAVLAGRLTEQQMEDYKGGDKTNDRVRRVFKNGNYSCQYGAGPPKIALTTGISVEEAKVIHKAYWDLNWFIKEIAKQQNVITVSGQKWLENPINGFFYSLREMKDIFSTLVQGTASYVFDMWVGFVLLEYDQLTAQFHDEGVWEIDDDEETKEWFKGVLERALLETNKLLNLNRELGITIQFGHNYGQIH